MTECCSPLTLGAVSDQVRPNGKPVLPLHLPGRALQ